MTAAVEPVANGETVEPMAAAEAVEPPLRVGFVLHTMQIAGAEVLVAETIRRLGKRIEPVVLCLDQVGALGERMLDEGVPVIAFNRRPGIDVQLVRCMARTIRERQLDVVHAHQYTPFFYSALGAVASFARPRVIFTEHGRHYPDVVSGKRRVVNRLVFDRLASDINAVCAFSADSLVALDGFRGGRVEVIENGVDLPRYQPAGDRAALKRRLGLDANRRYIVCIARFHPVKDHRTLLQAFALLASDAPDVDLLLAGDGPLRADLEQLANDFGIASRVRFLGVRDDVPDLLAIAEVFALTSVSEAASITLLEAMGSRVPVVVTAVGGNPEIVRDGVDGLLAPRGDAPAIAAAILKLLETPELAQRLAGSAAERVKTSYSLDRTIGRYYALYRRARRARRAGA
jgi:glycosyltransferase involved in cell wall biosynthesis